MSYAYGDHFNGFGDGVCQLKTGEIVFYQQSRSELDPEIQHLLLGEIAIFIETPEQRFNRDLDMIKHAQLMEFFMDYKDKALTLSQLKLLTM